MNIAPTLNTGELIGQAAAWRLASLLLERPRLGWHDEIEKLSREVIDQELSSCARDSEDGTEEAYHRLFGPGGAVSPREVSYCGFEDPGHVMAELASFYDAFSFQPRREEPIDHISVEAGFVGYLFLKETYAWIEGNWQGAAITREARERFIKEHVARCAGGMYKRMSDSPAHLIKVLLWVVKMAGSGE
jgi:nitrate reductase assembly molybdenum cofactor insertion protein NarJ